MKHAIAALVALAISPVALSAQTPWQPVGQLEMAPGDRVGPLNVSPMGELVAGSLWNSDTGFRAQVWTMKDGIAITTLDNAFPSLLPIRFAQVSFTPDTMSAQVYAHSRRALRSWTLIDGAPVVDIVFGDSVLANDVLYDGFRQTYIVSAMLGPLSVYSHTGAPLARIETDALRPHGAMTLSRDGDEMVVASAGFTLTGQMAGLPYQCDPPACEAAYGSLPRSYGPYEELLAVDTHNQRLASLAPIDPERVGQEGGIFNPVAEPTVRIWAALENWGADTAPVVTLTGFANPVRFGEFAPDGARFLTLDEGHALAVWDAETGVQQLAADGIVTAHFIPNSDTLFVHRTDGTSAIVAIANGDVVQTLQGAAEEAVIAPDGQVLITYSVGQEGPAWVWQLR